jgi:DNA-binding NarL/FixJ family response regulator
MIRIVIADDHPIVRQGLRFFLEQQPDMSVVGVVEAKTGTAVEDVDAVIVGMLIQ